MEAVFSLQVDQHSQVQCRASPNAEMRWDLIELWPLEVDSASPLLALLMLSSTFSCL